MIGQSKLLRRGLPLQIKVSALVVLALSEDDVVVYDDLAQATLREAVAAALE